MIVPLPQFWEKSSGFAFGLPHRDGSFTRPSSVIPLVHSGVSSTKLSSTRPHSEQVGRPSGEIIFTPEHSRQKLVFTGFCWLFLGNNWSKSDQIAASIMVWIWSTFFDFCNYAPKLRLSACAFAMASIASTVSLKLRAPGDLGSQAFHSLSMAL